MCSLNFAAGNDSPSSKIRPVGEGLSWLPSPESDGWLPLYEVYLLTRIGGADSAAETTLSRIGTGQTYPAFVSRWSTYISWSAWWSSGRIVLCPFAVSNFGRTQPRGRPANHSSPDHFSWLPLSFPYPITRYSTVRVAVKYLFQIYSNVKNWIGKRNTPPFLTSSSCENSKASQIGRGPCPYFKAE